jgi:glutamyl-tRNA synthetase
MVRVRFAPSPTGYLHIGGARTALFNWLFARANQGSFVLRIEDTDLRRSSDEMVEGILQGLKWLGLDWDEGPYYQSNRLELYSTVGRRLLNQGKAYRCFCPTERTEEGTLSQDEVRENHACRRLSSEQADKRARAGEPSALRFAVPSGQRVCFEDLVYGRIEVDTGNVEDFVIQRSDGMPTYHLGVVADDIEMQISHVIRGADHLSNTGKHILLYEALGEAIPSYAHLPLILGPDKKRLSKRHGATSVLEYREMGHLPEAVVNYLALLGWSSGRDQEFFSREELIASFDLKSINKANAVFDLQKLEWMNGHYIRNASARHLASQVGDFLRKEGLWSREWEEEEGRTALYALLDLLKSRAVKLTDFAHWGEPFLRNHVEYETEAVEKYLKPMDESAKKRLAEALDELRVAYSELEPFALETTERSLRTISEKHQVKAGAFIGAVRVALTGRSAAPGIFDVILALGRERTVQRLKNVLPLIR